MSFGKDSIAQLIKIKELGLPLDEVVYVDIRYTPEISGEHPIMAEWIPTAEKIIKEKLGITVKHLAAQYSFREYFYRKKKATTKAKYTVSRSCAVRGAIPE